MSNLEHATAILRWLSARRGKSHRVWVPMDELVQASGLTPDEAQEAIEFLARRAMLSIVDGVVAWPRFDPDLPDRDELR